jgi:hypothetical protein
MTSIDKKDDSVSNQTSKESWALTDWISIIDSDYERITQIRNRRSRTATTTLVLIFSITSLGWGLVKQYDLTWHDVAIIAPWWVAVNFLFMAVSALYIVYLRVYLPGIAEEESDEQKWPMLAPEGVVNSLAFFLMAIGSAIAVWNGLHLWSAVLFVLVFIWTMGSGISALFNVNPQPMSRKAAIWAGGLQERYKISAAGKQKEFTSGMVALFFFLSIVGLLLLSIVWNSEVWLLAIQASFLLSAFIAVVVRNLWEFGRIAVIDRTLSRILDIRMTILTDKTLNEDAIAAKYQDIFGKKAQEIKVDASVLKETEGKAVE